MAAIAKHSTRAYPREPTILAGREEVPLPGYELWMTFIKNVHVVPSTLNSDTFLEALSEALRWYPHAAGRLQRHGSDWKISLSNSPIPVDFEMREALGYESREPRVVRDDLTGCLNVPPSGSHAVNEDAPLLRFKVVVAKYETSIGVSWHHTLGDAAVLLRFMRLLSQHYQGLPPLDSAPTFTKHMFPTPSLEMIEQYSHLMPHLTEPHPQAELGTAYNRINHLTESIHLRIQGYKLRRLRDTVAEYLEATGIRPSVQDCLTAYLMTVLNRCLGYPISQVTNAASYRRVVAPFIDPDIAGNAIYIILSHLPVNSARFIDLVLAIRSSVEARRAPEFIENWMCVASYLMLEAANGDSSMFFSMPPDRVSVNSNVALDWRSAHFGFPDAARFFTSGVNERYIRVFRANPTLTNSGKWVVGDEDVDVTLGIAHPYAAMVAEIVNTEFDDVNFPANFDVCAEFSTRI